MSDDIHHKMLAVLIQFMLYTYRVHYGIILMKLDYNYVWMVYHIIFYFLHQLVYLVYSGIIVSFYQGGTGVPCTPFCVSAAPLCCHLPALLLVGGDRGMVYSGEMRCLGEWVVCGSPGVPTWRVWTLRHPPTGSAAHWSSALAPGILVCSSGWRAPNWSQSYSWHIRMS